MISCSFTDAGSRPPFDASSSPPYRLHGRPPSPMGQPPWTKADAERLAGAVAGAVGSGPWGGGNTELHWAAGRGDTQRVGELLRAEGAWVFVQSGSPRAPRSTCVLGHKQRTQT